MQQAWEITVYVFGYLPLAACVYYPITTICACFGFAGIAIWKAA